MYFFVEIAEFGPERKSGAICVGSLKQIQMAASNALNATVWSNESENRREWLIGEKQKLQQREANRN